MVSLAHSFGGGALKSIYVPYFKKFSQKSQIHYFVASRARNRPFFPGCHMSGVIAVPVSLTSVPSSSISRGLS